MYTNATTRFYYQPDSRIAGYNAYSAPFRSFVWDSGVSGSTIINSVNVYQSDSGGNGATGSPITISRGQSGMMVDFVNGRILFSGSSVGTSAIVSGSYSFKDFNVYFANQGAEKMVFSDKYYLNSRFARPETGIPAAHDMVTPCIFVTNPRTSNSIRGFGGEQDTQTIVTLYVMAETQGHLENALSLLASSRDLTFPQLPASAWPLNLYGDYKSGYSYPQLRDSYASAPKYTIVGARSSKVSDSAVVDESVFVGQVDLTLHMARNING